MTADRDDVLPPAGADFLGAFGVLERADGILMVQNRRVIDGREVLTWDLPGGQVEARETLLEALARELDEEVGIEVVGRPEFLFYQDGERVVGGARQSVWRSFFFEVVGFDGEPRAGNEIVDLRWMPRAAMAHELTAPYHDSFLEWLDRGGRQFACTWQDPSDSPTPQSG